MTNTFNTLGTSTSLDPWNPAYSVSSESSSRPRTEALRDAQWTSPTFQNTPWDRRQRSPRPQPPTRSTALIERVQDLDIAVTANYDDELSMEARSILEDILFRYQQKREEVNHLQRLVGDLRKEALLRKRKDSEEPEACPPKRRETKHEDITPAPVEPVPSTSRSMQDYRTQAPPIRVDETPRPAPRLRAPVMAEAQSRAPLAQRDEGTTINGRHYEVAIEVTPPGQLVPYPNILLPPPREIPSESDDPYGFDESDEDNDETVRPEPENAPHLHFDGYIPDFWGARHIEGLIGPNVIIVSASCYQATSITPNGLTQYSPGNLPRTPPFMKGTTIGHIALRSKIKSMQDLLGESPRTHLK